MQRLLGTGSYALVSAKDTAAGHSDEALRHVLEAVRNHTTKSAAVEETAFSSTLELFNRPPPGKLGVYKHGQYRGCGTEGTFGKLNARYCMHQSSIWQRTYRQQTMLQNSYGRSLNNRPLHMLSSL